jgi:formylglycine-generating enzyme required for sulfatase activity
MGCSGDDIECYDTERPAHQVEITRGFWIGQTEVTQAAFAKVMGENPSLSKGPLLPVEEVRWAAANAYCAAVGLRLPTEAEWEYAARGGMKESRYRDVSRAAWYRDNSGGKTQPVGTKQPNRYGLYDMLGNVWEWTADWYAPYAGSLARDPIGPSVGRNRALRGGSWREGSRFARASYRFGGVPTYGDGNDGFRCAGGSGDLR